jgi:rSAM/selenodomain-associated transferase 2
MRPPSSNVAVSVIVPVLNEAAGIDFFLRALLRYTGAFEVIVVDGGSTDGTPVLVHQYPRVRLINGGAGRAKQMNEGAARARGDILLFLHADSVLPEGACACIGHIMSDNTVIGGSFTLAFDRRSLLLDVYSRFSRINHVFFTYGDQGLFVRRAAFRAINGFKEMPLMEDVEIQTRLRKMGRFVKVPEPVITSARRFVRGGILRQQLRNIALVCFYHAGVAPRILKRFYPASAR